MSSAVLQRFGPYDDFVDFVEQAGLQVSGLPAWKPAQACETIADSDRRCYWLRRTSNAAALQQAGLRQMPRPDLATLRARYVCVVVRGADDVRLRAYIAAHRQSKP